jgi:hypothetical protein
MMRLWASYRTSASLDLTLTERRGRLVSESPAALNGLAVVR